MAGLCICCVGKSFSFSKALLHAALLGGEYLWFHVLGAFTARLQPAPGVRLLS